MHMVVGRLARTSVRNRRNVEKRVHREAAMAVQSDKDAGVASGRPLETSRSVPKGGGMSEWIVRERAEWRNAIRPYEIVPRNDTTVPLDVRRPDRIMRGRRGKGAINTGDVSETFRARHRDAEKKGRSGSQRTWSLRK